MELMNDLFVPASLALVLSFLVAKLVSMAMADRDSHSPTADDVISMAESSLRVQTHQSERKVQVLAPESVKEVDEFTEINVAASVEIEHHPESDDVGLTVKSSEEDIVSEEVSISKVVEIREETMEEEKKVEEHGNRETSAELEKEEIAVVKERDEEEREVKLEFEEDDDWEGVERSELEKVFMAATDFVVAGNKDEGLASIGNDEQVELYGLHKLATEGPCRDPQPMPLMLSARAKWNAWQKLGNMNPEVAMEQYITLLSNKVPGWMEDNSAGKGEQELNKSELFDSAAIDSSTSFYHQQNLITERELEKQSGAQNCSLLVESDLDNNVKNDDISATIL